MNFIKIFPPLLCIILLTSCTEEEFVLQDGDIQGIVRLFDDKGYQMSDQSGTVVSIENTSYSATTNENGVFEIRDVPAGTYEITASNTISGALIKEFRCVGGNVPYDAGAFPLYQKPKAEIFNYEINYDPENYRRIVISGEVTNPNDVTLYAYIGNDEDILISDNRSRGAWSIYYPTNQTSSTFYIDAILFEEDLPEGDDLYVVIVGQNKHELDHDLIEFFGQRTSLTKLTDVIQVEMN